MLLREVEDTPKQKGGVSGKEEECFRAPGLLEEGDRLYILGGLEKRRCLQNKTCSTQRGCREDMGKLEMCGERGNHFFGGVPAASGKLQGKRPPVTEGTPRGPKK